MLAYEKLSIIGQFSVLGVPRLLSVVFMSILWLFKANIRTFSIKKVQCSTILENSRCHTNTFCMAQDIDLLYNTNISRTGHFLTMSLEINIQFFKERERESMDSSWWTQALIVTVNRLCYSKPALQWMDRGDLYKNSVSLSLRLMAEFWLQLLMHQGLFMTVPCGWLWSLQENRESLQWIRYQSCCWFCFQPQKSWLFNQEFSTGTNLRSTQRHFKQSRDCSQIALRAWYEYDTGTVSTAKRSK